jgi:hypothetical protein
LVFRSSHRDLSVFTHVGARSGQCGSCHFDVAHC